MTTGGHPVAHVESTHAARAARCHQELTVRVHEILFIAWFIVFAFWLVGQFKAHNRRKERDEE